jgi:hypothetical protein
LAAIAAQTTKRARSDIMSKAVRTTVLAAVDTVVCIGTGLAYLAVTDKVRAPG